MDIVRFGIVGMGGMGNGHARNMPRISEVRLTAVCDIAPVPLQAAMDDYEVPGFATHGELLDSGLVDAILIATPHYHHPPIAVEAMRRGAYDYLGAVLGPYGLELDYEYIERTRPKIAEMLR